MDSLLDIVHHLFENTDGSSLDIDGFLNAVEGLGIDLSNFTADDIRSALDSALGFDVRTDLIDNHEHILHGTEISFGNHYDDRTAEFIVMMKSYGVEIPSSVDHSWAYDDKVTMDRHSAGGMLSIDKSICRTKIENAFKDGSITKDVRDKLLNKLSSC